MSIGFSFLLSALRSFAKAIFCNCRIRSLVTPNFLPTSSRIFGLPSSNQAVEAYKELSEVERGFRELKDLIEMRPIYHHRPKRVRAHIFVAALAFLLACDVQRPGIGSLAHHGCSSAFPSMTNPAISYSR